METETGCAFCGKQETPNCIICSICVQEIINMDRDKILKFFEMVTVKPRIGEALKIFLGEMEDENGKDTSKCINRKTSLRPIGIKKTAIKGFKVGRPTLYKT